MMTRSLLLRTAVLLAVSVFAFSAEATPIFMPLEVSSSGVPEDVSGDGTVAVGASSNSAVRWDLSDGSIEVLPPPPDPGFRHRAHGVNQDGTMIAGRTQYELVSAPACCQAVLWEEGETPVNLGSQPAGPLPSVAYAISADGSTIVGNAGGAAMWGVDGSFLQIEYEGSTATAVSADGSVVAGTTSSLQPGTHLFTWTADDGLVLHTDVRAGSQASGVFLSDDGTTVFGGDPTTGLYLWTELAGVEYVPGIDAPAGTIYPTAMSGDGTVLAASSNYVPYVSFDAGGDWVILDDFLLDQGVDLGTWTLWRVTGLSSDGSVLVGYGTVEGDSGLKPFAVFLPEPGAALLCGMAAIALAIGRREHA